MNTAGIWWGSQTWEQLQSLRGSTLTHFYDPIQSHRHRTSSFSTKYRPSCLKLQYIENKATDIEDPSFNLAFSEWPTPRKTTRSARKQRQKKEWRRQRQNKQQQQPSSSMYYIARFMGANFRLMFANSRNSSRASISSLDILVWRIHIRT